MNAKNTVLKSIGTAYMAKKGNSITPMLWLQRDLESESGRVAMQPCIEFKHETDIQIDSNADSIHT